MNLEQIKSDLPEYAKDIKLNLGAVLSESGSPDLSQAQMASVALASAYATRNANLITALRLHANDYLSADEIKAAQAAATIMAMNNIYYRFTHAISDQAYGSMPPKLRMNVLANPGSDKISFELASLAVSAINGCGMCMNAHALQLEKAHVSKLAIQSAVRIASVMNATALAMEIGA